MERFFTLHYCVCANRIFVAVMTGGSLGTAFCFFCLSCHNCSPDGNSVFFVARRLDLLAVLQLIDC